jgi:haloalkane dehalogenase
MVNADTPIPDWLKTIYPFQPKKLSTLGGARLSYVDEGPRSDEAVVMVHGNPTWSFYYRSLITALSPKMRCVALDHIGMGLSDKPQDYPYTLERRIADLDQLITTLGLKKVHLVVHDWGGAIGLGWGTRNADKVRRIVILNTGAFLSQRIPLRIALCKNHPVGTWIVRGLNGFTWPANTMAMSRRKLTDDEKRAYLFPHGDWNDRVAVNAFVKDIPLSPEHPSYKTLEGVGVRLNRLAAKPIRILWGGKDFCFDQSFYNEFLKRFPKANATYYKEVGHYVTEDAPEDFVREARQHLVTD